MLIIRISENDSSTLSQIARFSLIDTFIVAFTVSFRVLLSCLLMSQILEGRLCGCRLASRCVSIKGMGSWKGTCRCGKILFSRKSDSANR